MCLALFLEKEVDMKKISEQDGPRVFVIQDLGFDFTDAEKNFGELIFLLERRETSVFNVARITALIKKRLWDHGFRSSDYLLAVGSPATIMLAGVEAAKLATPLQVLQWDREQRQYYSIELRG